MDDDETNQKFSVEEYHRDMNKIQKGEFVDFGRIGLPKPGFNVGGVMFLLMLPVLLVWLIFMDPLKGWNRWRVTGVILAILFTLGMFSLMVFVGVQHEIGGEYGLSEGSPEFVLIENMGTGGLIGIIFMLWPRTIILIAAIVAIISAINYFL